MRRIELGTDRVVIALTGLTMLEAWQGRLVIPYANILRVYAHLHIPPHLLRVGGTTLGTLHEGHYVGDRGWYFLSYENPERVLTLDLDEFRLGHQQYAAVAIEVDDPVTLAQAVTRRLSTSD